MDATDRFPLPSESFDYIFSEHLIEHISYAAGNSMLSESFRVLKQGGKVRISTPDLAVLLAIYTEAPSTMRDRYVEWVISNFVPDAVVRRECFVINNAFRNWGHTFIYDHATLEHLILTVGFEDIRWFAPHESDDPHLRGIETHGQLINDEEINRFEVMILEATKPRASA
jgi:predicted SAM-dependent methyltransferase